MRILVLIFAAIAIAGAGIYWAEHHARPAQSASLDSDDLRRLPVEIRTQAAGLAGSVTIQILNVTSRPIGDATVVVNGEWRAALPDLAPGETYTVEPSSLSGAYGKILAAFPSGQQINDVVVEGTFRNKRLQARFLD